MTEVERRLTVKHLGLAKAIAHKFTTRFPSGPGSWADKEEFEAVAAKALCEAAWRNDKRRGDFPTYAASCIRGQLWNYVRSFGFQRFGAHRDKQPDFVPLSEQVVRNLNFPNKTIAQALMLTDVKSIVGRAKITAHAKAICLAYLSGMNGQEAAQATGYSCCMIFETDGYIMRALRRAARLPLHESF
jgi:hypothetical protein